LAQQPADPAGPSYVAFTRNSQNYVASIYFLSTFIEETTRLPSLVGLERVPMGKSLPRRRLPGAVTPNCGPPTPFCLWPVSVTTRRNRPGRCCVALHRNKVNRHLGSSSSRPVSHSRRQKSEGGGRHGATELDLGVAPGPPTKVSQGYQGPRQRPPAHCRGTRTRRDRIASNGAPRLPGVCFWSRCLGPPDVWDMRHSNLYRPDLFLHTPYAFLASLGPCCTLPGLIFIGLRTCLPRAHGGFTRTYVNKQATTPKHTPEGWHHLRPRSSCDTPTDMAFISSSACREAELQFTLPVNTPPPPPLQYPGAHQCLGVCERPHKHLHTYFFIWIRRC